MDRRKCDIGMVGLGVMGRNLLLNIAEHGFAAAGFDKDPAKLQALAREGKGLEVHGAPDAKSFLALLRKPRIIIMLVPAGSSVDSVVHDLRPGLAKGDLLIDGGNSHFYDTDLRAKALAESGILFMGVGISGGEQGARYGASIMPGGPFAGWRRVRRVLENAAAKVDGRPCVTWLGPGSAGHYVKMVHNGIEYGLMQLISETYDLMKRALGLSDDELQKVYARWGRREAAGFLLEITAEIFRRADERTTLRLVDVILDRAAQKGTGKWTAQEAMELQVPVPTIDAAVAMRDLSGQKAERVAERRLAHGPKPAYKGDRAKLIAQLEHALFFGMIATYAQGFAMLESGRRQHGYDYSLADVARIWRGGCIIRSAFLADIASAFRKTPGLANLLMSPAVLARAESRQADARKVAGLAIELGIPAPALAASVAYYDGYRSEWLPANLIQAQRDFFGSHTYERVDEKGAFHTQWSAAMPKLRKLNQPRRKGRST